MSTSLKVKRKLKNEKGETIVETLYAMLVIVLAFAILCGGVVTAAKINKKVQDRDTSFHTEKQVESAGKVTISHQGANPDTTLTSKEYKTDNGYYYYEYTAEE